MGIKLGFGDCRLKMVKLADNSIDSMVTDPPAGIAFMGKKWDTFTKAEFRAFMMECMSEAYRIMKPGAHGLVWALPRTSHWTADALEDVGFEIRDKIFHAFSSGFPKSLSMSKAIDKELGCERPVIGSQRLTGNAGTPVILKGGTYSSGVKVNTTGVEIDITGPGCEESEKWDDWHTNLKPSVEEWIMVRKPLSEGSIARNVLKWGVGAINVGACRIDYQSEADKASATPQGACTSKSKNIGAVPDAGSNAPRTEFERPEQKGRHPAQFIMTCVCNGKEHDPDCPVAIMNAQSGTIKGSKGSGLTQTKARSWKNASIAGINRVGYDDTGGASRFFYVSKPSKKEKGENNTHPTVKSVDLMKYLVTLITPPGGTVLDPFAGSGTTGVACIELDCNFRGYEADEDSYWIARERLEEAL